MYHWVIIAALVLSIVMSIRELAQIIIKWTSKPDCSPHEPGKVSTVILPGEETERYHCCGHRSGRPIPARSMGLGFMLKEPGRRRQAKRQWNECVRGFNA